jgi:hypothetical protein
VIPSEVEISPDRKRLALLRRRSKTASLVTAATKISSCVDCGLTLLGERLRCPACHAEHANALAASAIPAEEDVTGPRPRVREASAAGLLARWALLIELFAVVALALTLCVKGCSR